jgi:hypothetical protein
MEKLNATWLCALLVASGKISALDVAPNDLNNFWMFINRLGRRRLLSLEDALEFAWDTMASIEGDQAIKLVMEIGAMRERVRDLIYETAEINSAIESLVK